MSGEENSPEQKGFVVLGRRYSQTRAAAVLALLALPGAVQTYDILMTAIYVPDVPTGWRVTGVIVGVVTGLMLLLGVCLAGTAIFLQITGQGRPQGRIFDLLIPPADAEHRALELEIAFEKWAAIYSPGWAWTLYAWHATISIALYWYDRSARRTK